ncbi:YkvA family protein [Variovorax sp. RT4R15]|uniref:YkvA family protein n=1 Tax=Variovorax sp. RT4R15 TaxID=3443737 RepID=UPI003F468E31
MWKLGKLWLLLRKELALVWAVLRDPRAPKAAKLTALLAVLYVLSPIDLVSDFIPVLGWIDDGVVAMLLIQLAMRFLPPDVHTALKAQIERRFGTARAGV